MIVEVGDRVKFIRSPRENIQLSDGEEGTVWRVTPIGTVRVKWDNGARFDLDPHKDEWEVIANGHKKTEIHSSWGKRESVK